MSGPVGTVDTGTEVECGEPCDPTVEVSDDREATVGAMRVRRALPRRGRRTVGAWCFADHFGPELVTETSGLDIGPHPHMGLQTVTWLLDGAVLHHDSLGSEQVIRPGQLNLMTAGAGVAHAEEAVDNYRGTLHGVQLWVAQPEATRNSAAAFEHHADLPMVDASGATGRVIAGTFAGATSPARHDTELVGVELDAGQGDVTAEIRPDFEYAIVVLDGEVVVGETPVRPGQLGYLGLGRDELRFTVPDAARLLLLGGVPFPEPVMMWWNFVARTREELAAARTQWQTHDVDRFPDVTSRLARIPAPPAL